MAWYKKRNSSLENDSPDLGMFSTMTFKWSSYSKTSKTCKFGKLWAYVEPLKFDTSLLHMIRTYDILPFERVEKITFCSEEFQLIARILLADKHDCLTSPQNRRRSNFNCC